MSAIMQRARVLRPWLIVLLIVASAAACKRHGPTHVEPDADIVVDAGCEGLGCFVVDCGSKGLAPTTITGTVYAPNGTLPLYGVNVYVPINDPGPLPDGAQCDRCANGLPGGAYTQTATDEAGNFSLRDVPATANVPLVIQVGKWRRQLTIPNVAACQDTPLPATETSLPRSKAEGELPKIAIATGDADALECLAYKLGIADSEFSIDTGAGSVHMFRGDGAGTFGAGWAGGAGPFPMATALWSDVNKLKQYDIAFFSCEGSQNAGTKSQAAMDAVKAYADLGGRVFLSHWHNIWVGGAFSPVGTQAPAVWPMIAAWGGSGSFNSPPSPPDIIDEAGHAKGVAFATWMENVMATAPGMRGLIPIGAGRQTVTGLTPDRAERWVYWDNAGTIYPQIFQFTTPNEEPAANRCGKVVFSDMHVSSGSTSPANSAFPVGCSAAPLTPQEKALAFIFFDISSCVGPLL